MSKVIAIRPENTEALELALKRVQARCTARTVSVFRLEQDAERAEKQLAEMGVARKARVGCRFELRHAVPRSYQYAAMGTHVVMRRLSTGDWGVEGVWRVRALHEPGGGIRSNM